MRLYRISLVLVIMLAAFALLSPHQSVLAATVTCSGDVLVTVAFDIPVVNEYRLAGTGPGLPSTVSVSSAVDPEFFTWVLPGPGSWNVHLEWRRPPDVPDWDISQYDPLLVITCQETGNDQTAGPPYANLLDGRINDSQSRDGAAPVAVYCASDVIDIYKIDPASGDGSLVIRHPVASGQPSGGTQLLAESEGVSLFWLTDGQYQLNTTYADDKPYVITWEGCSGENLTHLAS